MNIKQLKKSILFREMTPDEISQLLDALTWHERSYEKEDFIYLAGDLTNDLCFVETGSVSVENTDWNGNRSILQIVPAGQFFAETYAFLKDEVMSVDVRANKSCRILFIRIGSLSELIRSKRVPPVFVQFLQNLLTISSQKNLTLSRRNFHTAPKSSRARIMAYLQSVSVQKHTMEFDIPFDRQQMADYLNLDRTALSKELGNMRKDGLLTFRKNHFHLLKETDN